MVSSVYVFTTELSTSGSYIRFIYFYVYYSIRYYMRKTEKTFMSDKILYLYIYLLSKNHEVSTQITFVNINIVMYGKSLRICHLC
jgi:hypothetical protein